MDQSVSLEREVKLDAPEGIRLDELGGEPIEPRRLTSVYYDTPDRRLLNLGLTLRRRSERRAVWQLKLPRVTGRMELQVDETGKAVPESSCPWCATSWATSLSGSWRPSSLTDGAAVLRVST